MKQEGRFKFILIQCWLGTCDNKIKLCVQHCGLHCGIQWVVNKRALRGWLVAVFKKWHWCCEYGGVLGCGISSCWLQFEVSLPFCSWQKGDRPDNGDIEPCSYQKKQMEHFQDQNFDNSKFESTNVSCNWCWEDGNVAWRAKKCRQTSIWWPLEKGHRGYKTSE